MKYRIIMALACLTLSSTAFSATLCQQKEQDIQRQISHAEKHGNQHRFEGLKKALSEVKEHCTDDKLKADHQKKIATRERKLAEAHQELKVLESREF